MWNFDIGFFALWVGIGVYLLYLSRAAHVPGLGYRQVATAFIFKVFLGCVNLYVWIYVIGHGDSLRYMHDADIVYNSLKNNPHVYFELLTRHSLQNVPAHLIPYQHELYIEWHVPEYNMVRLFALLHVLTNGSAWADIVIIALLSTLALTTLCRNLFPKGIPFLAYLLLFFLPSMVFWSGGLLKEGPTIILIACMLSVLLRGEKNPILYILLIPILLLMYLIRDYLLLILIPNIALYFGARARPQKSMQIFVGGTLVCCLSVYAADMLLPEIQLPSVLTEQQSYFLASDPDPDYSFHTLESNYTDILLHLPAAGNNVLFRPNFFHSSNAFRIYQSAELILLWFLVATLLYKTRHVRPDPSGTFLLFVALELLLLYGLLVTDADTLSRYRTLPVFLILLGILHRLARSKEKTQKSNHII